MPIIETLLIKGGFTAFKLLKAKAISGKIITKVGMNLMQTASAHGLGAAASTALTGTVVLGGFALTASVVDNTMSFIEAVKARNNPKAIIHLADIIQEVGSTSSEVLKSVVGTVNEATKITLDGLAKAAIGELKGEAIAYARKKAIGY